MLTTILIYAQDTTGLGHIRRCTTIARALLERRSDTAVLLATKSRWPASFDLGERFDFLKLPAQLTQAASTAAERDAAGSAVRSLRRALLREAVMHLRPQLILVDNEPLGFGGDMIEALDAAPRDTRLVFGMRDVVDDPERTTRRWAESGALDALRERFDRIIVYGHPDLFDTLGTYDLPGDARARAVYNGYVCAPRDEIDVAGFRAELGLAGQPFVLVTGGGGIDAMPVLELAIEAARLMESRPRLLLVTGPLMSAADRATVTRLALPDGHIVRSEIDMVAGLAAADAAVTMGGYNTLVEAMMLGRRPIVLPRATHKQEQLLRARALEARGLVTCLGPGEASPGLLARAVGAELQSPGRLDARRYLDLHGRRAAGLLLDLVA
jgi:predicted glycosyltransferase